MVVPLKPLIGTKAEVDEISKIMGSIDRFLSNIISEICTYAVVVTENLKRSTHETSLLHSVGHGSGWFQLRHGQWS